MKHIRRASRRGHTKQSCACGLKQVIIRQRSAFLNQQRERHQRDVLHQSRQYYESLLDSLNGIIWEFDLRTQKFLFVSQKAEELLGYPVTQWLTETNFWENHIHPSDREWVINGCHQLVLQKREGRLEYRMIAADGRIVWIHDIISLVLEANQPIKIRGVLIDITESQRTKEALHRREQEFRVLAENSPDVITRVDRTFRYLYVNAKIEEKTGIPPSHYIGKTSRELGFPEELVTLWHHTIQRVFDTRQEQWIEFEFDSPTGHIFNHARLVPEFAADGSVKSVLNVIRDITEYKQLEMALQESEARFRAFMQHSPTAAWILDTDGRVIYVNDNYYKTLQFSATEPIGKTAFDLFPVEIARSLLETTRHVAATDQTLTAIETAPKQDGTTGTFLVYKFPLPNPAGTALVGGVAVDITDLKRAEEALGLADFSFERSDLAAVWIGSDARILRVNEGSCRMLGYSREELQSKYVYELDPNFPATNWSQHWQQLQQQKTMTFTSQLQRKDGSLVPIETTLNYLEFNGKEYNFAFARDISERLRVEAALHQQAEREKLLGIIAQRIRQSLDLTDVLRTTVTEVRQLLRADRTIIFRFNPDWSGVVMVESVHAPCLSMLGESIDDPCFLKNWIQFYQQGRVRAIEDIFTAGLGQCYVDLLTCYQVRANLVVPILQGSQLWGLLIAHQCSGPRKWQPDEIDLLQQLSVHVAIAMQQSELYQQAQTEIRQRQLVEATLRQQSAYERLVEEITNRIRRSLNLDDVLAVTVDEVRNVLDADRVLVFQLHANGAGSIVKEAVVPAYPVIKEMRWVDECFPTECYEFYRQGNARVVPDVTSDDWGDCLGEFMQSVAVQSKIVAPIVQTLEESGETRVWGLLIAHACAYQREWQPIEVELLERLADKLAIAIQQAELHQQVQQLNSNLETQVQERTFELQQALALEALLKRITDKVRDSLDETQILQTAVQELAIGLNVLCCDIAFYNLEQENSTIVCEYVASTISRVKSLTFPFSSLPEIYGQLLQGQYVQFCTLSTSHFWRQGPPPHFTILSCPLMDDQGVLGDLWLFRLDENSFNALEIRLVKQVANQCAIALRQSRLYQAAQAQVIELERLNQLKDDFLSTVSHELRTPMSNIKMAIQMLEVIKLQCNSSQFEPDRADRYFGILQSECEREINLINDLLDLTRLDAGDKALTLVPINLKIWITQVLQPFEQRTDNQRQQLKINLPPTIPPITVDASYLERIFTELLNNACKYTPAGGQIEVAVELLPVIEDKHRTSLTSLLITVCNSGIEIPSHELERIFDKFYRIPNNDPWKHGGTGLGLALVKRLVERMNGTITVNSSQGQTRFTIQLPLEPQSI